MSQKTRKVLGSTSKGTVPLKSAKERWRTHVRLGAGEPSLPDVAVPSRSSTRNMPGFAGAKAHYPRPRSMSGTGELSRCRVCRLPSVLLEMKRVRALNGGMETVLIPSQGPSTHRRVERWCAGSCMAIMCVLWEAMMDIETVARRMKKRETRNFWKMVKRKLTWMAKQVRKDLEMTSKNFYGVRP
jgi:hypothetical protein